MDQDVHELEKEARLQEIYNRMDPRAQTPVPGKGPFGRDELLRRKLIHDGCLLWKTATGRFKGQWSSWQTSELDILCELQSPLGIIYSLSPSVSVRGKPTAAAAQTPAAPARIPTEMCLGDPE